MTSKFGDLVLPSPAKQKKIASLGGKMASMRHLPIEGQNNLTQRAIKYESLTVRIKRFSNGWDKVRVR